MPRIFQTPAALHEAQGQELGKSEWLLVDQARIDLFAEAGGLYTCDLFHDDQPTPVKTRSGKRFVSVPYSLELNDTIVKLTGLVDLSFAAGVITAV